MIKRIDLFMPPYSRYGVLHHMTKKFFEGLQRAGVNCRLLEAERTNPKPFLEKLFADPPDCTFSFNGLLPDEEGRFFSDLIRIPHVCGLVDSPNHFFPLIRSQFSILSCVDRFGCDFFRGLNFSRVFFLPHGVEADLEPGDDNSRDHEVLMLSSYIDYEALAQSWQTRFPAPVHRAMNEAARQTLQERDVSYVQLFVNALDKEMENGADIDPRKLNLVAILDEIETFIRGRDRVELVRAIKDARVDIYGSADENLGWKQALGSQPNVHIHEAVDYLEALDLMKRSKIVLNSCSWIKNGTHERTLAGMACGAVVVTEDNIYMREHFKDEQDLLFYRVGHELGLNTKINALLDDDKRRQQIAHHGREMVMKNHTWDQRALMMLRELEPLIQKFV